MTFKLAPSPHSHIKRDTAAVMRLVCYALIPGVAIHWWVFGSGILIQLVLAVATALLTEMLCMHARHRSAKFALSDYTAVVTGVLLALSIPSLAPWWIIVIGTMFSIAIAKHVYGGIGQNLFNPAMTGYVVLLISFPVQMTSWPPVTWLATYDIGFMDNVWLIFTGFTQAGYDIEQLRSTIDGVTMATPLDTLKTGLTQQLTVPEITNSAIFNGMAGEGWWLLNTAFFLGGLALIKTKIINWHIPVGVLLGIALPAMLASAFVPDQSYGPVMHLFSGATMLGAFFIATDPVSAATSNRGRLIFGLLIGFLTYVIRVWGGYPDGIAFAVLLANMCVPMIDKYTRPAAYGERTTS